MKKIALVFLCLLLALPAWAASNAAKPAALSAQDKADLARIETYLNGLKNVSADFMQVDEAGGYMRGQIAISRPGKMRVTYAPPNEDFIIADGDFVHIWDGGLKAQTNVPQGSSLAEFILRDPVRMSGDVTVTKIARFPAKIEVSLTQSDDPAAGTLTLVFEDKPLLLRQWKVLDPQGHETGVNLQNMSFDAKFPDNYFDFVPPNFGKR